MYMPVPDFPWYLACSDGYIINADTGYVLRGSVKKTGYVEIQLLDEEGKPHYKLLHRIIADCFCEKRKIANEVNHIDGIKTNNHYSNLEWVTREENLKHAYENGLMPNDATPKKVEAIDIKTGEKMIFDSIYQASKNLDISQGNICMCCKGKRPYASGFYWRYDE